MNSNLVICIGRQFGSGGHEIGKGLAQALKIPFYDKEILKQAAKESGIVEEMFEKADEKPANSLLYSLSVGSAVPTMGYSNYSDYLTNEKLFLFQSNTIQSLADKGSCVMIGRCADYILRNHPHTLSAFIHAPLASRVQRIMQVNSLTEDAARALIKKTDKQRANYYSFYTDKDWNHCSSYDVTLDSGKYGVETCISILNSIVLNT